jgi:hypothetical protein
MHWLAFSEEQISKGRPARFIETANLAIKNGAFDSEVFRDPAGKLGKAVESVTVSRNQFALTILDVSERPESIDLQLVNEQIGVERFRTAGEPDGA